MTVREPVSGGPLGGRAPIATAPSAGDTASDSASDSLREATVRCYLAMVRKDAFVTTGAYEDTVRKVDGEWRFVRRHVVIDPVPE